MYNYDLCKIVSSSLLRIRNTSAKTIFLRPSCTCFYPLLSFSLSSRGSIIDWSSGLSQFFNQKELFFFKPIESINNPMHVFQATNIFFMRVLRRENVARQRVRKKHLINKKLANIVLSQLPLLDAKKIRVSYSLIIIYFIYLLIYSYVLTDN